VDSPSYSFRGYAAAGFRVDDPSEADLGSDTAYVHRLGTSSAGGAPSTLRVFRPGVNPPAYGSGTPAAPVGGRPAFFVPDAGGTRLVWQYAAGAYAVLSVDGSTMTRPPMRVIAEAFSLGVTRPAVIGFATARVPSGYRLVAAGGTPSLTPIGGAATSHATFLTEAAARALPAGADPAVQHGHLEISLGRWNPSYPKLAERGVTCGSGACYRLIDVGDGDYVLTARGDLVSASELSAALTSTRPAALYDLTTWWEVDRAFPASALLPG
jgi:hypothetical protein